LLKPTKECAEILRTENIHTAFYGRFDPCGKFRGASLHPAKIIVTSQKTWSAQEFSLCWNLLSCFSILVAKDKILLRSRHRNDNCKEEHATKW